MPRCIYCRAQTTGKEGRAHIVPEAIFANDVVMPPGSQCDGCNNYLKKLDSTLASHSGIALWIQALGLPGKSRRPRRQLGWYQRARDKASQSITVQPEGVHHVDTSGAKPVIAIRTPQGWKQSDFHRALHCVAFNMLSLRFAEQRLLDFRFDRVRNYVRRPARGEVWAYSVAILGTQYVPGVDVFLLRGPNWPVILRFFNQVFVVELLPSGTLHQHVLATLSDGVSWHEVIGRRSRPVAYPGHQSDG
jgi:hypothetical protein